MADELSLGRVSTAIPVQRSNQAATPKDTSMTDGILSLGKMIAGGLVQDEKRKQFYAGQERVLTASLEGTQKEELQSILDEEPYFMKILGPSAMSEGAVEMAARVGAGKVFDGQLARLSRGEDLDVDPDTYRKQVMEQVNAQRTGNEQVDSIFFPQIITKAQGLISTHMTKHLERTAKTAAQANVTETWNAVTAFDDVTRAEQGDDAEYFEGTPRETMTKAQGHAYSNLLNTLDPETKPFGVEEAGWLQGKVAILVPALESGNNVIYQASKESGLFDKLSPEDRVKLEKAKEKGKIQNDSTRQLKFVADTQQINTMVFNAKTTKDVEAVKAKAIEIRNKYLQAGITVPKKYADDEGIMELINGAQREKNQYDEKMENRRYAALEAARKDAADLAKINAQRQVILSQANSMSDGIRNNAIAGFAHAPLKIVNQSGQSVEYTPTKQERLEVYQTDMANLRALPEATRNAKLKSYGVTSMEQLAYKYDLVDPEISGQLTHSLRAKIGHPDMDDQARAMIMKMKAIQKSSDPVYAAQYLADPTVASNFKLFNSTFDATQDANAAWARSFGRNPTLATAPVDATSFNKAAKSKSVVKAIEEAGRYAPMAKYYLENEAKYQRTQGLAQTDEDAFEIAVENYNANSEIVGKQQMLGVPYDNRIEQKTGIKNPVVLDKALKTHLWKALPKGLTGYQIDYNPISKQHMVIPVDDEDNVRMLEAFPLDYSAVKAELFKDNWKRVPPKGKKSKLIDDAIYGGLQFKKE